MSKEHLETTVRVKCRSCKIEHTAIIPVQGKRIEKTQCPGCGIMTENRKLELVKVYGPVEWPVFTKNEKSH